jgi:hypothetical protein
MENETDQPEYAGRQAPLVRFVADCPPQLVPCRFPSWIGRLDRHPGCDSGWSQRRACRLPPDDRQRPESHPPVSKTFEVSPGQSPHHPCEHPSSPERLILNRGLVSPDACSAGTRGGIVSHYMVQNNIRERAAALLPAGL